MRDLARPAASTFRITACAKLPFAPETKIIVLSFGILALPDNPRRDRVDIQHADQAGPAVIRVVGFFQIAEKHAAVPDDGRENVKAQGKSHGVTVLSRA